MQNNTLTAALQYAERGFSVIPVRPDIDPIKKKALKEPYVSWTEFQKRRATTEEIRQWWSKWPKAMVGIVTGEISGIFVVDCDTQAAYDEVQKHIPDNLLFPIERTPRGGWHLFFKWLSEYGLTTRSNYRPGVDIRTDGGFIIVAPSINADGGRYAWVENLAIGEVELPPSPSALLSALIINKNNLYKGCCHDRQQATTNDNIDNIFKDGNRDDNLYHIALSLAKTGNSREYIKQTLTAITSSWGEIDETWINAKVESAFKRISSQDRNLTADIREYVLTTSGNFLTTDVYQMTTLTTREDKKKANVVLGRLVDEGIIERSGNKNGCFRRVENDIEPIDWRTADTAPLNLVWPFGIHNLVNIYPGNIGIIAGYPNAGKTAFIHNFIRFNQQQHEVHLFSSEGGPEELKMRLLKHDCPLDDWKFKYYECSCDFADVIRPDAINIIDYLEIHDDFYKVGGMIKSISDKLKNGFALIAIQKNSGRDEGLGGARGLEKPRLYMAMDAGRLKIVKAKSWVDSHNNPNGQAVKFKIVDGCKFKIESKWERSE